MEKLRISQIQALMLGISTITITGHLLFIPVIINHAGRDSWLSLLATLFPAMFIGYMIARLADLFPGQSIIEYSQVLLGKWLGRAVGLVLIFYFFHNATLSIRGFGEFYTSAITPRTPILIYFVSLVIMAVYTVKKGLEVMARTNQIFLVMLIPVGLSATLLTQKDKDYGNFLPVLEYGPEPMLTGALVLVSLYSSYTVLGMVFPFVSKGERLKWPSILAMVILILMFMGPITGPIALFGAERASGLSFPTFQILRDMQVGELQRLDLLGIMLWSLGAFANISVFLYATTLGLAQWLRMEDHKILVIPLGVLMVIVALLNSDNYMEIFRFFKDTYPYYSILIGFMLPLFLLVVAKIRYRQRKSSRKG